METFQCKVNLKFKICDYLGWEEENHILQSLFQLGWHFFAEELVTTVQKCEEMIGLIDLILFQHSGFGLFGTHKVNPSWLVVQVSE